MRNLFKLLLLFLIIGERLTGVTVATTESLPAKNSSWPSEHTYNICGTVEGQVT